MYRSPIPHTALAVNFMSFWRLPRRPSPIYVRPAAARARQGLPPLPPPAVVRARRGAPRPHGRLQVGRSWRSLSDLELSDQRGSQDGPIKTSTLHTGLFKLASERVLLVRVNERRCRGHLSLIIYSNIVAVDDRWLDLSVCVLQMQRCSPQVRPQRNFSQKVSPLASET